MKDANFLINNGVNVQKSLELFGDMDTYNATLHDFLNDAENKLAQMKSYKEVADMANYAILVHSLKSDSKYFGFEQLAEMAYQHEMESKANHMYYVTEHYDELVAEARRIIAIVKQYLGVESVTPTVPVTATEANPAFMIRDETILVVDDSDVVRNFIKKIFNNSYEVIIAADGQQAIDAINSNPDNKIIGMLLDLNMPNVDGFAVLDYFRTNHLFSKIPVAIITGESSRESVEKAFTYPITDVLRKPFNELNIKAMVEKMLMTRESVQ